MSRREDIDNAIWADPDFEILSAEATLLYLWSWTNPRCGMAGIYKVSERAMTESKLSSQQVTDALVELADARFAFYEDQVLWVRTRVKHLRSRSPQMAKSIAADVRKLSSAHPLVARFLAEYSSDKWLREYLPEGSGDPQVNLSQKTVGVGDSDRVPEPSVEVPGQRQGQKETGFGEVGGSGGKDRPPEEIEAVLPAHIVRHGQIVHRALSDYAAANGLPAISKASLARVMRTRAHKPFVRAVEDYLAWQERQVPSKRHKDLIRGYEWQLDNRCPDLAAVEVLNPDGLPVSPPTVNSVVHINSRAKGPTAGDLIAEINGDAA